jgi:hypothetical protein
MWLVATQCVAVFLAAACRNAQAARAALSAAFAGILVSDRYNAYTWVDKERRQLWSDVRFVSSAPVLTGVSAVVAANPFSLVLSECYPILRNRRQSPR